MDNQIVKLNQAVEDIKPDVFGSVVPDLRYYEDNVSRIFDKLSIKDTKDNEDAISQLLKQINFNNLFLDFYFYNSLLKELYAAGQEPVDNINIDDLILKINQLKQLKEDRGKKEEEISKIFDTLLELIEDCPDKQGDKLNFSSTQEKFQNQLLLHLKNKLFDYGKEIARSQNNGSELYLYLKEIIKNLVASSKFGEDPQQLMQQEHEDSWDFSDRLDQRNSATSELYLALHNSNLSQEKINQVAQYLINNKIYPKNLSETASWDPKLLKLISEKYSLNDFPPKDIYKILSSDIGFLESKFKEDKEIFVQISQATFNKFRGTSRNIEADKDDIIYELKEQIRYFDPDLQNVLYRFVLNNFETYPCVKLLSMFDLHPFPTFLLFYHSFVKKIDLGMLKSGYLYNNFYNVLKSGIEVNDLKSALAAIKALQVKDDNKIIAIINRSKSILSVLHNNDYSLPRPDKDYNFLPEKNDAWGELVDKSAVDLFLCMIASTWDMSQDVTNKIINVALNRKIDQLISDDPGKVKRIAEVLNINLNKFRQELLEIRFIVIQSKPIPFSWKEKIYKLDSELNSILSGDLLLEYASEVKPKDKKLFDLNYQLGNGLNFEVLPDKSMEHFKVGAATQCCQRAGGAAETAMIDSFINPLAGVLALKKGPQIIAQSYFHYVPQDNAYILDNVEANLALVKSFNLNLDNIYANLAQKIQQDYQVAYVKCATQSEYNKLTDNSFTMDSMEEDPRYFELTESRRIRVYKDFHPEKHIELTKPTFDLTPVTMTKKQASRLDRLVKLAESFSIMAILRNSEYVYSA